MTIDPPSYYSSPQYEDYQDILGNLPRHSDNADDGTVNRDDYEERVKVLTDKLSTALMDAASKYHFARQHAKIADEAVSSWQTLLAEVSIMQEQWEAIIEKKLVTEDMVMYLDGALNECKAQIRRMHEEQEGHIHRAIMKKSEEWDELRNELRDGISALEQQCLDKNIEYEVASRSLAEQACTIHRMRDSLAKAQAQVNMLQIRLEYSEKEKAAFKYELSVVYKELEARNMEKGLSERDADATYKRHSEDAKKIAEVEVECENLQKLIKKIPSQPSIISDMKLAEGLGDEKTELCRKSGKRNVLPVETTSQSAQAFRQEDDNDNNQRRGPPDHYSSSEDLRQKTSKSKSSTAAEMIASDVVSNQSVRMDCHLSENQRLEEELTKANAETVALDVYIEADSERFNRIEEESVQLRLVKWEPKTTLHEGRKEIELLDAEHSKAGQKLQSLQLKHNEETQGRRSEISEAEQRLAGLQSHLTSVEFNKKLGENQLNEKSGVKSDQETQLRSCQSELGESTCELDGLRKELLKMERRNLELEEMCKELKEELELKSRLSCPECFACDEKEIELWRELEIAAASEKLAECEYNILILEQQLQALVSPKGYPHNIPQVPQSSEEPSSSPLVGSSSKWSCLSRQSSSISQDNIAGSSSSARLNEPKDCISNVGLERTNDSPRDPPSNFASEVLDLGLTSLSTAESTSRRKVFETFDDSVPVQQDNRAVVQMPYSLETSLPMQEDNIAVVQMPSSLEAESIASKKTALPTTRNKGSRGVFGRVVVPNPMNETRSSPADKHISTLSKFFSRTKTRN
ncbi:hypothetical protein KP509_01G111500 [Ceratopteris richardii]|uniref:Uncharacterized protein n=1 Tax=Ceratopteris richardii TaxID=49495 RepID=A0A8T2VGD3_CERRI|nr:hypothetical protein KP509_01G111500 [Ceratopteris richardii]